ncbi:hypothetical protein E5Z46_18745 [Geobacillus kaustophilus NBRC 102445]|uniref:hypothetical protein n=1 Tax=Geobacillus kaustophilus TaxID=1462 RepID=UPI0010BF1673|nr:hypothetical protein [Geobacillus kaustophilus]QCK84057.1 hypothetical protein E5Z46_18745 [Geobacillus kaustophilus NBRC 102445]QHB48457.1 hypothetical protein GBK1_51 [Geobacillus phage GBK1]
MNAIREKIQVTIESLQDELVNLEPSLPIDEKIFDVRLLRAEASAIKFIITGVEGYEKERQQLKAIIAECNRVLDNLYLARGEKNGR